MYFGKVAVNEEIIDFLILILIYGKPYKDTSVFFAFFFA